MKTSSNENSCFIRGLKKNISFCRSEWTSGFCVSLKWLRRDLSLTESRPVHAAISNKTLPASSLRDLSADKAMMNGVCTVNDLRCERFDCCPERTRILLLTFWMGSERQDSEGKPLRVEAPVVYKSTVPLQPVDKARKCSCSCIRFNYKATLKNKWHAKKSASARKVQSIKVQK